MTVRFHLFPFRTQKLSSLVPKIVGWKRPVKIGRCRLLLKSKQPTGRAESPVRGYRVNLIYAPLAQLVEQLTLNQWVLGSSPRWCTKNSLTRKCEAFFLLLYFKKARSGAPSGILEQDGFMLRLRLAFSSRGLVAKNGCGFVGRGHD